MKTKQSLSDLSETSKTRVLDSINTLIISKELQPFENVVKILQSEYNNDSIQYIYRELLGFNQGQEIVSFESETHAYLPLNNEEYKILTKYKKMLSANHTKNIISHGLQINLDKEDLIYKDKIISISDSQDMSLLKMLAENAGSPVSYSEIYETIFNVGFPDDEPSRRTIRDIKKRLRETLIEKLEIPRSIASKIVIPTKRQHFKLTITNT